MDYHQHGNPLLSTSYIFDGGCVDVLTYFTDQSIYVMLNVTINLLFDNTEVDGYMSARMPSLNVQLVTGAKGQSKLGFQYANNSRVLPIREIVKSPHAMSRH